VKYLIDGNNLMENILKNVKNDAKHKKEVLEKYTQNLMSEKTIKENIFIYQLHDQIWQCNINCVREKLEKVSGKILDLRFGTEIWVLGKGVLRKVSG